VHHTCQKAAQHLHDRGGRIAPFRDLAQPLKRAELEVLARKAGGAEKLFSKRAMKYPSWASTSRPSTKTTFSA
jgi:arsenate reductase